MTFPQARSAPARPRAAHGRHPHFPRNRITSVAKDTVPLALYQQAERDRDREVQGLTDRVKQLEERPGMSLGRWLGNPDRGSRVPRPGGPGICTLKGAK